MMNDLSLAQDEAKKYEQSLKNPSTKSLFPTSFSFYSRYLSKNIILLKNGVITKNPKTQFLRLCTKSANLS
jgi:hypothetical protein